MDFLLRIPLETIPNTFRSIFRNKRRAFALLSGVLLATIVLSGIIVYNDRIQSDNFRRFVGNVPFEVRFSTNTLSTDGSIQNENVIDFSETLIKAKKIIDENDGTGSSAIVAYNPLPGSSDTLANPVGYSVKNNESVNVQTLQLSNQLSTLYFVKNGFFNNTIGENILQSDFMGSTDLTKNSIVVPQQFATANNYSIGDIIQRLEMTTNIIELGLNLGPVTPIEEQFLTNLTIIGTYRTTDSSDSFASALDQFVGFNSFINIDNLNLPAENSTVNLIRSFLTTEVGLNIAVKIDETFFPIGDTGALSTALERYTNEIINSLRAENLQFNSNIIIETALTVSVYLSIFTTMLFLFIAIPVIFLSYYLLLFGLSLSLEERRREIAIQKMQGASPGQIFGILRNETFVLLFLGLSGGYIIALACAWLVTKSSGFLKFSFSTVSNPFSDFIDFFSRYIGFWELNSTAFWAIVFPVLSLVLILGIATFRTGKKFIAQEVTQGVARQEWQKEGIFTRNKIDILMFLPGVAGLFIVIWELNNLPTINPWITVPASIFAPFLLWIGGALVGSRLVKLVPLKLEGGFLRLPIFKDVKNIIRSGLRRRGDIDKLAIIIVLTLSIASISIIQGTTEETAAARTVEWQTGSDLLVNFASAGTYGSNLTKVSGVEDIIGIGNSILLFGDSAYTIIAYENSKENINFQQNDPVVFWQVDNFIGASAENVIGDLTQNKFSAYTSQGVLDKLDASVGATKTLNAYNATSGEAQLQRTFSLNFMGRTNHLPGITTQDTILVSEALYREVLAINRGLNLNNYSNTDFEARNYLAQLEQDTKADATKERNTVNVIKNFSGVSSVNSYKQSLDATDVSISGLGISGLLSLNFVIVVTAVLVSAFSFSAILIERRRFEFAILRSIGATKFQIYKLALGENSLMMLTGCIWGTLIGLAMAYQFNGVFSFVNSIFNATSNISRLVHVPVLELIILTAATFLGMLLATLISLRSAANQDLSLATRVV